MDTTTHFLGKKSNPKDWLIGYPGLLANVKEFEIAASGSGTVSVAEEPDGIIRRVPLISNVAGTIRPTLGLDMIRVAFQGNSIATRTGLNGVEEIIIQINIEHKSVNKYLRLFSVTEKV